MKTDFYAILGIAPDADQAAIKVAYRRKANQFHPDKNPSPGAVALFREIQEAYETLSDVEQRKNYDDNRRRSLIENPEPVAQEIWSAYIKGILT